MTFRDVWNEFVTVVRKEAPKQLDVLQPPAPLADIERLEVALRVRLPADYRGWLQLHDGCKPGFETALIVFDLLSVDRIMTMTRRARAELADRTDDKPLADGGWNDTAIFIGESYTGWELVMDCADGIPLCYQKHGYASPLAASFSDYIAGMTHNIRKGEFSRYDDGRIGMGEWGERLG